MRNKLVRKLSVRQPGLPHMCVANRGLNVVNNCKVHCCEIDCDDRNNEEEEEEEEVGGGAG